MIEYELEVDAIPVGNFFNDPEEFYQIEAVNSRFQMEELHNIFFDLQCYVNGNKMDNWELFHISFSSKQKEDGEKIKWNFDLTNPETCSVATLRFTSFQSSNGEDVFSENQQIFLME